MVHSKGCHTVFYHRYHIVWATKYRYQVLTGELRLRVRETIRQVCAAQHDWGTVRRRVGARHGDQYLSRSNVPMPLKGLIFGPDRRPMSPTHTKRRGRTYRYYLSRAAIEAGYDTAPLTTVPAGDVEAAVLAQLQHLLTTPEMIARVWGAAKAESDISEAEVTGRLAETAATEKLSLSYVSRIARLALLAPDIVEAILGGGAAPRGHHAREPRGSFPVGLERTARALDCRAHAGLNRACKRTSRAIG